MEFYRVLIFMCLVHFSSQNVEWVPLAYRVRQKYNLTGGGQYSIHLKELFKILHLGRKEVLRQEDSYRTVQGNVVLRFKEYVDGRDVKDSQLDVSVGNDGTIERIGGRISEGLGNSVDKDIQNCKLSKDEAESLSLKYEGWDRKEVITERIAITEDVSVTDNAQAVFTIAADITWIVTSSDGTKFTRKIYTINTCKKTIMDVEIHMADVYNRKLVDLKTASVQNVKRLSDTYPTQGVPCDSPQFGIGGNIKIGKVKYGTKPYCLDMTIVDDTCYLENAFVKVVDMHDNIYNDMNRVVRFPCRDGYNDKVNGGYSAALDTFYHITQTIRMYNEWYNFHPIATTRALVHFDSSGSNAFWDGKTLLVGDGSPDETFPFSTLDTVAHEISHGVTERRSGLKYSGQSGGINEAFSDISGEVAEMFVRGQNDWVVGADVTKADGVGIRYFDDPKQDGISISHFSEFQQGMDVHKSSGLFNKAFYLVSQEIGPRYAFKAFLLANRLYWHEKCTFEEAACEVIKASYDTGHPMEIFQEAFTQVGLLLSECEDLQEFMVTLNDNATRNGVSASTVVHPLFHIDPPTNATIIQVFIPGNTKVNLVLTTTYIRSDILELTRSTSGLLEFNLNDIATVTNMDGDSEYVLTDDFYLRIEGTSERLETFSFTVVFH